MKLRKKIELDIGKRQVVAGLVAAACIVGIVGAVAARIMKNEPVKTQTPDQ